MRITKLRVGMRYVNRNGECVEIATKGEIAPYNYMDITGEAYSSKGISSYSFEYDLIESIPKYSFRQLESGALRVVNNYNNNTVMIVDKYSTKDLFELLEENIG